LYYTNPKSTPLDFAGMFEAACVLRERHKNGLNLYELDLPFWGIEAYKIAERVYEIVEAEVISESSNNDENNLDASKNGDTDTFSAFEQLIAERQRLAENNDNT
jgi:hypothetical protein